MAPGPVDAVAALWRELGLPAGEPAALDVRDDAPVPPTVFDVGTLAGASVGAALLAAAAAGAGPGAAVPPVTVGVREAWASFRSERCVRLDGEPIGELWAPLSGDYRAADGWVRLHANFDHHRDAACRALGVPAERAPVAAAVRRRGAREVEDAVLAAGGVAGALRTRQEWRAGAQYGALAGAPVVSVRPLEPAAPEPVPAAGDPTRPLAGVRVLDLTRVIAGPVCGRALAALGADVLHVGAAHLPTIPLLDLDTGLGKRRASIDLREAAGRAALRELVAGADVLVQCYRPGALAARGFGPADLAAVRPGIVAVDVSAYGPAGPWAGRRGFDSVVQLVTGLAHEGGVAAGVDRPVPLPAQALDHATGWLAALGVLTALRRRAAGGWSWRVDVSLARTAAWLDALGRVPLATAAPAPGTTAAGDDVADLLVDTDTPAGRLTHVRMPGRIGGAPLGWAAPADVPPTRWPGRAP